MKNRNKVYAIMAIWVSLFICIVYLLSVGVKDNPVKIVIYSITLVLWAGITGGLLLALEEKLFMKYLKKHNPEIYNRVKILRGRNENCI